jgi:hypothetical protein
MHIKIGAVLWTAATVILTSLPMNAGSVLAQIDIPRNIDQGLRQLVQIYRKDPEAAYKTLREPSTLFLPRILYDTAGQKPAVDIYLNGTESMETVINNLKQLGFTATATSSFQGGGIEGYVPIGSAVEAAQIKGVRSVSLVFAPL